MPSTTPSAFKRWFNSPSHSDTLLRVHCEAFEHSAASSPAKGLQSASHQPDSTGSDQSTDSGRSSNIGSGSLQGDVTSQQWIRTYHAHALVLRAQSAYFDASLDKDWQQQPQQQQGMVEPCSAPHAPRLIIDLQLQPDELDAMDLLLRFTYGFDLPAVAPHTTSDLIQCLRLADRFHVPHCVDTLISNLKAAAIRPEVLHFVCDAPPGITDLPSFQALFGICKATAWRMLQLTTVSDPALVDACKCFIIHVYGDVLAVIRSDRLRQEFCSLPFAAVLAWAESDELQVHSENCVVYLLSTWVKAAQRSGGQGVSAEQLEQLAQQVRVLHLGPAYQHHILPQLGWFKGCKSMAHLPTLLAFKGKDAAGKVVFPAAGMCSDAFIIDDLPKQWVAKARQRLRVTDADQWLTWTVGGRDQLQQLHQGTLVSSSPLYLNGFTLRLQAQCQTTDNGTKSLGLYVGVDPVQAEGAIPWPDTAAVAMGRVDMKVLHGSEVGVVRTLFPSFRQGTVSRGYPDVLSKSVPSVSELLIPYLKDGALHLQATFTTVDKV